MTRRLKRSFGVAILYFGTWAVAPAVGQPVTFQPAGTIAGPAELIRAAGGYAYVSAGKTITIVDISRPGSTKSVGSYSFPAKISGFSVSGPLIYVAADLFGFGILDAGNPAALSLRGALKTRGQAKNVAVSGTTALVADVLSGIDVIDVSNPSVPVQVGSIFLEGVAAAVTAAGRLAYASDRPSGFYVMDTQQPTATAPLSAVQSPSPIVVPFEAQIEILRPAGGASTTAVLIAGGFLQFFDVSRPESIVQLPSYRAPFPALRATLVGTRAYVAAGPAGVQVIDLSTPAMPRVIASYATMSPAVDVAVDNSLVLVALAKGDVIILRTDN
jgi:hypothetical protein